MDDNVNKTSKTQIKHLQTETLMNCNETNLEVGFLLILVLPLQIYENMNSLRILNICVFLFQVWHVLKTLVQKIEQDKIYNISGQK